LQIENKIKMLTEYNGYFRTAMLTNVTNELNAAIL
jgi:hypothetical protein